MATSAFKSTSKRGNSDSNPTQKSSSSSSVRKRSLSVSAVSRAKQSFDISTDFSNKRENPLFWASVSSPIDKQSNEISASVKKTGERDTIDAESTTKKGNGKADAADQRGRSVARNSGVKNGIGRSISRVRRRSVSRGLCGAYESEKEQEVATFTGSMKSELEQVIYNAKNDTMFGNGTGSRGNTKITKTVNSQGEATECSEDDSACSFQISNWEDGISTCSLSEAEEKTIKAVCEQMKVEQWSTDGSAGGIYETVRSEVRRAISDIQNDLESVIRRNKANAIATLSVADVPRNLVDTEAVEFVMDIRKEYAWKLGESEDRARKLRADLAVEEHRGKELSRILQEILPEPKTSKPQKSQLGRKRSSERKKISRRLTEEAMAFFDECVSISTLDSSDFSAPEDPPRGLAGPTNLVGGSVSASGGIVGNNLPLEALHNYSNSKQVVLHGHNQHMSNCNDSNSTANSRSYVAAIDQADLKSNSRGSTLQHQFSFAQKPKENFKPNDIQSYIRHFERGVVNRNTVVVDGKRSAECDASEHVSHGSAEKLLFERFLSRNRVESGVLHLCIGNFTVSFPPFGSVV